MDHFSITSGLCQIQCSYSSENQPEGLGCFDSSKSLHCPQRKDCSGFSRKFKLPHLGKGNESTSTVLFLFGTTQFKQAGQLDVVKYPTQEICSQRPSCNASNSNIQSSLQRQQLLFKKVLYFYPQMICSSGTHRYFCSACLWSE